MRARKNIQESTPYIAGKPIEETRRELHLREVVKLASNENPLGASPKAVAAIRRCLGKINRYPDSNGFYLKEKLARTYRLSPQNFVLGNGSDELIDIVIKTFVEDDENIVTAQTTFVEYEIIAKVNNRSVVTVPLKDFTYDLEAMLAKIDAKTKLVFIANPNNPTGTYVNRASFERFLGRLPGNAIVVLDEAYDTFIDVDDYPSGVSYILKHPVLVLKTFSKAYGLSGLRIGYCIGDMALTGFMEKARQPFNVNLLAQAAALAALDDDGFLRRTHAVNQKGKGFYYKELSARGIAYVPSVTNFVLIDVGTDCAAVFQALLKLGVIVRDMKQYGLNTFIRVTIGTPSENKKFFGALDRVLPKQQKP